MKDEHDNSTAELLPFARTGAGLAPQGRGLQGQDRTACRRKRARKLQPERLPGQEGFMPPDGAKPFAQGLSLHAFGQSLVPVSAVARDWSISARRVRAMLNEGRLAGQQQSNGYWEVFYPYRYVLGTRGPGLKRQQRPPGKPKNPEAIQERQP